jgi:hypothetical protein
MVLHQLTEDQLRDRLLSKMAAPGVDLRSAGNVVDVLCSLVGPATRFVIMMEEKRNAGFPDVESLLDFLREARDISHDLKAVVVQSRSLLDDYLMELQGTFPEYPDRPPGSAWKYEGFLSSEYVGAWIVERFLEAGIMPPVLDESMVNINLVNVSNFFYEFLAAVEDLLARDYVDAPGLYEGFLHLRMRLDDVVQSFLEGIRIEGGGTFPGLFFGIGRIFEALNVRDDTSADHHYLA